MTDVLRAENVTKRFGGLVAVHDIDFSIPEGSIVSLIGPNGAGKTTFFNIIAGIYDPTSGTIEFRGRQMIAHSRKTWLEPVIWVLPSAILGVLDGSNHDISRASEHGSSRTPRAGVGGVGPTRGFTAPPHRRGRQRERQERHR